MSDFVSEDKVKANISIAGMLKQLWPYARRHPVVLTLSCLSVLGVAVSSRMLPTIIGYAIDSGIQKKDVQALEYAAYAFLGVEIAHSMLLFFYQYLFNWYGNRMLYYIREDLVRHTQDLPMNYFNRTPLGRIVTRLNNDTNTLGEVFTDGVINLFTESVVLISIIVAMGLISVKLMLAVLAVVPLFTYLSYVITVQIRNILRESKLKLSVLNSYVAENLNGIKVIQLFFRVPRNRKKFTLLSRDYRDVTMESIKKYALLQPVMNTFNAVTITTALYYGGYLGHTGALELGALVAFLMNVQDFIHPLRDILEKYQQFQNSLTSAERVFQLLDESEEKDDTKAAVIIGKDVGHLGRVEFRNLTFSYEAHMAPVLTNINLQIEAGQSVALVGRTGSGKTTLVSLLQRFYNAEPNTIFIEGQPIENYGRKALRKRLGVVQQDNFIFRGTIADNVHLGEAGISREQVEKALDQVGYLHLLKRSGRTIDSQVEEKGANLSVGERQLLAFARILAFQPDILILDEATANIDSESERIIQVATKKVIQGRTSIIIAHRLSTIQECDKIVVLDAGRIQEVGSHHELLSNQGMYAQLAWAGVKVTDTV